MSDAAEGVLFLRTDAGPKIGIGHVMRSLALGRAWAGRGFEVHISTARCPEGLRERAKDASIQLHDLDVERGSPEDAGQLTRFAENVDADWVVLDGYAFGPEYQDALEDHFQILLVDDFGYTGAKDCDFVLDQNLGSKEKIYRDQGYEGPILIGPQYALLRPPFREAASEPREIPDDPSSCLVTLGGSDPDNATETIVRGLAQANLDGITVKVVLGAANEHCESLRSAIDPNNFEFLHDIDNMAEEMQTANLGIAAAGTTSWELAATGLPSLQVILTSDQEPNAEALAREGVVRNLGWITELTPEDVAAAFEELCENTEERRRMAKRGPTLVDGRGPDRVLDRLTEGSHGD